MTRKDYVLLHSCIKAQIATARLMPHGAIRVEAIKDTAHTIAYCIRAENPAFSVERFMRDCGVTE